jgi:hypothetical protein
VSDFEFEVRGNPPGINDTYAITYFGPRCPACGRGQSRMSKKSHVEVWQESVAWHAKAARPSGWTPARRTVIEYEVYVEREGRDADGPLKALLDGIKVGLGCDDRGFLARAVAIEKDKANPRVVVRVTNAA